MVVGIKQKDLIMFNPRIQKTLSARVAKISKDFNYPASKGFIVFCLQNLYGLDDFEVEEAITDGGNDRGIDAIFSQRDDTGSNILFIVQSKFFENPDKALDEAAKSLMLETINAYVLGDAQTEVLNEKLHQKIDEARETRQSGEIDKVMILFLTNGQRPQTFIYDDLDRFCSNQPIEYQIFTEKEISDLVLPPSTNPTGEINLKVTKDIGSGDKTFLNLPDIDQSDGKVIRVDVFDIANLVENNKNIFNANVRGFLGKNKVNKQILETLTDKNKISSFIYLNNGITILCDGYHIKPGNESIDLINPSIINGCQTASTIFEAYKLGRIEKNEGLVIVRIIRSTDPQLKDAIIKASNTQSTVKNRDLISEDYLQKQLESQFDSLGYFYQRKRGNYSSDDGDEKETVDLEKAAQSYMALFLELPAEAKNKKAEIYDDYYPQIFHSQISAESLLLSFKLHEWFKNKIKDGKKRSLYSSQQFSLLGNALLHFLPLFKHWALIPNGVILEDIIFEEKPLEKLQNLFEKYSSSIITRLVGLSGKIEKRSDFKSYQYFFKSSSALTTILTLSGGETGYQIELSIENYRRRDLRYTKPQEYSLDGGKSFKAEHVSTWQDLFVFLMNQYTSKFAVEEGGLDFLETGDRKLFTIELSEEDKKLRKQIDNKLWLLTNFDSKKLADFCFSIARQLGLSLLIRLRPTKFRSLL